MTYFLERWELKERRDDLVVNLHLRLCPESHIIQESFLLFYRLTDSYLSFSFFLNQFSQDLPVFQSIILKPVEILIAGNQSILSIRFRCGIKQELFFGRPIHTLYIGHISSESVLDHASINMSPHVIVIAISCYLDFPSRVFRNEVGNNSVPSPSYNRWHRKQVTHE